jgi:prolipoprotein diacylglyceryltransferase
VNYPAETKFHPLFLYEALWSFLAFIVLYTYYNRKRLPFPGGLGRKIPAAGDFALLYLMQYTFIRFLLGRLLHS